MNEEEAAGIIDSMVASLTNHPSQFQIEVKVIGQSVKNTGGGTALRVEATGGGPGSNTIGQKVSVDGSQIEIARKAGDDEIKTQMQNIIDSLEKISRELKSQKPNKRKISEVYHSLKNTWVPQLVTSVLAFILTQALPMAL